MATIQTVWILTDGKMGDLAPCRGVAAGLGGEKVSERIVHASGFWSLPLPFMPVPPVQRPDRPHSPIAPPFPDVVIASGRRTLPYLRAIHARSPRTFRVFLKNPRLAGRGAADFVWAPSHDGLDTTKPHIFTTPTSPHTITQARLKEARTDPPFPAPAGTVTGLVLGGNSGSVRWTVEDAARFTALLQQALPPACGTVLVTTSRRTPDVLRQAVENALPEAWFDPDGAAYLPILAHADRLVVTGDSHNMVSEALATGVPVHVHRPPGLQAKLQRFLDTLEGQGAIGPLTVPLANVVGQRIDATPRIAEQIRRCFDAHSCDTSAC